MGGSFSFLVSGLSRPVSALLFHINNQKLRPQSLVNREDGGGASLIQADELLRSCFEFISEDIGWMFLMIFVSSFEEHSKLCEDK